MKPKKSLSSEFSEDQRYKICFIRKKIENYQAKTGVHIVISSGGPLNLDTSNHVDSLAHIAKLHSFLVNDGVLLACGLSPVQVNANEFTARGFNVLGTTSPHVGAKADKDLMSKLATHGRVIFYVCQKKAVELKLEVKEVKEVKEKSQVVADGYIPQLRKVFSNPSYTPVMWKSAVMEEELDILEECFKEQIVPIWQR